MNYYEILGVSRTATVDEIKKAYRKLAKTCHPDTHPNDKDAEDKFKKLSEAYATLSNESKRKHYDQFGTNNPGGQSSNWGPNPDVDINAFFRDILRKQGFQWAGHGAHNPMRNPIIRTTVNLDITSLYADQKKVIQINEKDGSSKFVEIEIPAGIYDGAAIQVKEKGLTEHKQFPPGDIIVDIRTINDPKFIRQDANLITEIEISSFDAMLGTEVTIDTPEPKSFKLKVPAGVQSGTSLKIAGQGLPLLNMPRRGDVIVITWVKTPQLSMTNRASLKEFLSNLKL